MARSYNFAIVRLGTNDARDERLNIGLVIFDGDRLDVRVGRRADKARALSAGLEVPALKDLVASYSRLDELMRGADLSVEERHSRISRIGPVTLGPIGMFVADGSNDYETRVASILRTMVDIEPAPRVVREKRSGLLTQVKRVFKQERVMAKRDEDLASHRIIQGYELDDGLVADLVLRNGAMHVVETVDATKEDESVRRAIADVAVSAIVLERARMKWPDTRARLVYSANANMEKAARPSLEAVQNQGAELVNWDSNDDRLKFIQSMSSLATPLPTKRKRAVRVLTDEWF